MFLSLRICSLLLGTVLNVLLKRKMFWTVAALIRLHGYFSVRNCTFCIHIFILETHCLKMFFLWGSWCDGWVWASQLEFYFLFLKKDVNSQIFLRRTNAFLITGLPWKLSWELLYPLPSKHLQREDVVSRVVCVCSLSVYWLPAQKVVPVSMYSTSSMTNHITFLLVSLRTSPLDFSLLERKLFGAGTGS